MIGAVMRRDATGRHRWRPPGPDRRATRGPEGSVVAQTSTRRARSSTPMATYQFLSEEWLTEARSIRADFDGTGATIEHSIRMNLVIAEVPFGEGTVEAHVDTSSGELVLDTGHIDPVDL